MGRVGFGMILSVFGYPIKRRLRPNQAWPKSWFRIHQVFGTLGPLLILVHSGAHFHALVPILAISGLGIIVLTGVVGQILHASALRTLNGQMRELSRQGLSAEIIETRLHDLASQEGLLRWWPWVHVPFTATFLILTLAHIGGALYFGGW